LAVLRLDCIGQCGAARVNEALAEDCSELGLKLGVRHQTLEHGAGLIAHRREDSPQISLSLWQPDTAEQGFQFDLDTRRPPNGIPINPARQICASWAFRGRAILFERLDRLRRVRRAIGSLALQMTQQHGLETGPLPEDQYVVSR
jgi:hypothetical protein